MTLCKLDIYHVRNIHYQSISPSPGINFIYGTNGSGKSSVLEAIYILGRAKSFRTTSIKTVINEQEKYLLVAGQVRLDHDATQQLGIQMDGKLSEIHINRAITNKRSDLAYALPLLMIHPKSYELLDSSPQLRREFLDWGVFNHDRSFFPAWKSFKRALSQRNAVLKQAKLGKVNVWDKEMVYYSNIVDELRRQYLDEFIPVFKEICQQFYASEHLALSFFSGWDSAQELNGILLREYEKDLRYGFTHSGPHRADLLLTINNKLAKDFVSRGQLKLLVLSLKLAQVQLLTRRLNQAVCVLIDDFSAELDSHNRTKLLHYLREMRCQVFISALTLADFGNLASLSDFKVFHVEHGEIKQQ